MRPTLKSRKIIAPRLYLYPYFLTQQNVLNSCFIFFAIPRLFGVPIVVYNDEYNDLLTGFAFMCLLLHVVYYLYLSINLLLSIVD